MSDWHRQLAHFQVAMMLLTRLPAGQLTAPIPTVGAAAWAFPVVGLIVGALGALGLAVSMWLGLPPVLAAGCAVITGLLATGGLHEDGLADLADGFGGGQTRARKLEIMRDSRIGSYGSLALVLSVGMRWQAIGFVAGLSVSQAVCAIVAVAMVSRAGLPVLMIALPPARADGLGKLASGGVMNGAAWAVGIAMVGLAVLLGPLLGIKIAVGVAVALAALGWLALRQIGGQTGDVLGAAQQICEVVALGIVAAAV